MFATFVILSLEIAAAWLTYSVSDGGRDAELERLN